MLRSAKGSYIAHLSARMKDEPKKFWRYVSHLSSNRKNNFLTHGSDRSANAYNDYFLSVPQEITSTLPPSDISPTSFLQHNVWEYSNTEIYHCGGRRSYSID